MVRLLDGPAAGVILALARAPLFLRVVRSPTGAWDALDLLADQPEPGEQVTVYHRVRQAAPVRLTTGTGRHTLWLAVAAYRVCRLQPPEDVLRDTARWREWCYTQAQQTHG